jgi:hypothetical protein
MSKVNLTFVVLATLIAMPTPTAASEMTWLNRTAVIIDNVVNPEREEALHMGLEAALKPHGAKLISRAETAAAVERFLVGNAVDATDTQLSALCTPLNAQSVAVIRMLAWDKGKKVSVFNIRVVGVGAGSLSRVKSAPLNPTEIGDVVGATVVELLKQLRPPVVTMATSTATGTAPPNPLRQRARAASPPVSDADAKRTRSKNLRRLGRSLMKSGRYEDATKAFLQCVSVDPMNARCHRDAGKAFAKLRKLANAANHYRCYLKIAPRAKDALEVQEYLRFAPSGECVPTGRTAVRPATDDSIAVVKDSGSFEVPADDLHQESPEDASSVMLSDGRRRRKNAPTPTQPRTKSPPFVSFNVGMAITGYGYSAEGSRLGTASMSLRLRNIVGQFPGIEGGHLHAFDAVVDLAGLGGAIQAEVPAPANLRGLETERKIVGIAGGRATLELTYLYAHLKAINQGTLRQKGIGVRVGAVAGVQYQHAFDDDVTIDKVVPVVGPLIALEIPNYNAGNSRYSSFSLKFYLVPIPDRLTAAAALVFDF